MIECAYCGASQVKDYGLCKTCLDNIDFKLKFNRELSYIDELLVACKYKSLIKELIIDFKFKDKTYYSKVLADIMTEKLLKSGIIKAYKYISFVPMHKKDLKKRGYNQAELMAKEIAGNTFLEFISPLEKIKYTKQQVSLKSSLERQENIRDAFYLKEKIGANLILVDDVVTSGASLNELGKLIKRQEQIKVAALVAATPSYT